MFNNNKRLNGRHIFLLSLVIISIFSSCVTQKKKDDVSKLKRAFHNMNAHYNGYYNANVLINESIDKLKDVHQDNYNQILDVYTYSEVTDAKPMYSDLDEAIKKSSIVISLHRPSKWVDDCYLNIGKSQFLKQDYETAEQTFLYLSEEFSPFAMAKKKARAKKRKKTRQKKMSKKKKKSSKKKRRKKKKKKKKKSSRKKKSSKKTPKKKLTKKEMRDKYLAKKKAQEDAKKKTDQKEEIKDDGKEIDKKSLQGKSKKAKKAKNETLTVETPKSGPFVHEPAYQEGQVWLARNYIQRELYDDAAYILRRLEQSATTFSSLKPEIAKAKADLLIKQKKYKEAIPALEDAVSLFKKRKDKVRLYYILGQLYQLNKQEKDAYEAFAKVVKYKPNYEMTFSAKMNVALNSWMSGSSTADEAITSLEKLLKDSKNKDYKDQLYFTLAKLYHRQGDEEKTIAALENSLTNNSDNRSQTVESSLMLADLYFAKADFINAKKYYDRALGALDKADDRYADVAKYSQNLAGIAANLELIQEQDSLLAAADMSEAQQRNLAIKVLEERLLQQAADKAALEAKANNAAGKKQGTIPGLKSTFFAYDPSKVKKGKRVFEKNWGDRPLKDNWRRAASQDVADIGEVSDNQDADAYSDADIANILKDLPSSPAAQMKAKSKIYQAMFDLGVLYRDRLDESQRSMAVLEDMIGRFPDSTRNELDGYYYLYLDHSDLNNTSEKQKYYDLILQKYGTSTYARVLENPNYLNELKKEQNKLGRYFDETYTLYQAENYQGVKKRLSKVDKLFGADNPMKAKFSLLSAMVGGAMNGRKAYIDGLKEVVANFKNTEEEKRAKEILRVLGEEIGGGPGSVGKASKDKKSLFKLEEKRMHFMLITLDADKVVVSDVKKAVSNFNKKNFKLQQFRISNIFLGSNVKNPIIVVRKFRSMAKAMTYFEAISSDPEVKGAINGAKIFPVSQGNYRQVLRQKSLVGYEEFFEANYK